MKNDKSVYRSHKSSDENRALVSSLAGSADRVPDDFVYEDLEAWKYAHMSHGEIIDFVNRKREEESGK